MSTRRGSTWASVGGWPRLLGNDRKRIELLNALLLSLPGTPVLYYGDEIGMGDNIYLGDRNGVRTPMQWSADKNAGFSRANPQSLYLPITLDPDYHYEAINVEAELRQSAFAALVDAAGAGPAQTLACLWARANASSSNPRTARSSAMCCATRGDPAGRGQPFPLCAASGAGSICLQAADAGRIAGPVGIPGHYRTTLLPLSWPSFLLLVFTRSEARARATPIPIRRTGAAPRSHRAVRLAPSARRKRPERSRNGLA